MAKIPPKIIQLIENLETECYGRLTRRIDAARGLLLAAIADALDMG